MPKHRSWLAGLAVALLAVLPLTVHAGEKMTEPPQKSSVPGWQEFVDALQTLPDTMLARLPDNMRKDPQVQQEVARLVLESIASQSIEAIAGGGDAPQFVPTIGQVLNIGQPNADTVYRSAEVDSSGSYRITGKSGSVNLAVIAQSLPPTDPNQKPPSHLDLSTLKTDAEGRYDVLVSPKRPEGYTGDWWELQPGVNRLMIRMVSSDWAKEVDPTISIERVDKPVGRPRPPAAELEQRLRDLTRRVPFMAALFVDRVEKMRQEGNVNKLKVFQAPYGALATQFYYEGTYDLADDEALIIESPVPASCNYRSLILTNHIYETTDWYNNHSSLNGAQAGTDPDGKLRIVVSAKDPGVKNWLDTAGYPIGVIQGRWTGCDSQPMPSVQKVKVAEVLKVLPKGVATVTPQQRQEIIRERRRALQERPLW